jgi:DNA-binding MarR family transcriptional regulator
MPYRLSVATNAVSQAVARAYEKKYRLSTQEWRLMAVLAFGGALTQQDLVRLTKMDKVTVSRAARALEERRFVRRSKDEIDARSLRLTLTTAGRKTYDAIVPAALEAQREILSVLDAEERSTLKALLERVETAAARVR